MNYIEKIKLVMFSCHHLNLHSVPFSPLDYAHIRNCRNPVPLTCNRRDGVVGETVVEQHEKSFILTFGHKQWRVKR